MGSAGQSMGLLFFLFFSFINAGEHTSASGNPDLPRQFGGGGLVARLRKTFLPACQNCHYSNG
jgi:hypothetical protein